MIASLLRICIPIFPSAHTVKGNLMNCRICTIIWIIGFQNFCSIWWVCGYWPGINFKYISIWFCSAITTNGFTVKACLFTRKYDYKSSLWLRLCSAWFWAFLACLTDREMNINDNVCAFSNTKWCLLGFFSVNHLWWSLCRLQIMSTPIENLRAYSKTWYPQTEICVNEK